MTVYYKRIVLASGHEWKLDKDLVYRYLDNTRVLQRDVHMRGAKWIKASREKIHLLITSIFDAEIIENA